MFGWLSSIVSQPAKSIANSVYNVKISKLFSKQFLKLSVLIVFVVASLALVAKPVGSRLFQLFGFDQQIESNSDRLLS